MEYLLIIFLKVGYLTATDISLVTESKPACISQGRKLMSEDDQIVKFKCVKYRG